MSYVQFLHFPSSIQHQVVRKMNLRELVKFSFCSKKTHSAVKSAEIPLDIFEGLLQDGRLEMRMMNLNGDSYEVCINPYELVNPANNGPEYIGFEGLRMYDYTEVFHQVSHAGIVILPDDQNFLETSDRLIGFLKSLFVSMRHSAWKIRPTSSPVKVILKKNFPKMTRLSVYPFLPHNQRRLITKKDIQFILEDFEVTDLHITPEVEEGFLYSTGFQQNTVSLNYPSWMHWDAILNSTSRWIDLSNVRAISSGDLNRLLKLWVSNEKLQRLRDLNVGLVRREGLEFPPDFLEFALEGIRNYDVGLERWREVDGVDPGQSNERKISRINGTMATVKVEGNVFRFQVDLPDE